MNNLDEMDDYENQDDSQQQDFHDDYITNKKNKPVKPHMIELDSEITEIRRGLAENTKQCGILRGSLTNLSHKAKDRGNALSKMLIEDLNNLEKDFKRQQQSDRTENDFFKQQINSLVSDKMRLQTSEINLKSRLKQCFLEIGMEWVEYDIKK